MKLAAIIITYILVFTSCSSTDSKSVLRRTDTNDDYKKAENYVDRGKLDSAFIHFDKAKDYYIQEKDSTQVATCLLQMAITLTEVYDFMGGEELAFQSLKYLDKANTDHHPIISLVYNSLGMSVSRMEYKIDGLNYYEKALQYNSSPQRKLVIMNNKAVILYDLKKYKEALAIYEEIIRLPENNLQNYARALSNFAKTKWRVDSAYNPLPDLWKAKDTRKSIQNEIGMNSSYAHLSEYYEIRNQDSATFYAKKRLSIAQKLKSPQDILNGLSLLVRISPASESKELFGKYKRLSDSIQIERSRSRNQFASIRYEVEKNKVENLRLQNDNAAKKFRINSQRLVIVALSIVALLLVVIGYFWLKRRQQRLVFEANTRIKNNALKTSRKVHDIVANGLYRVMAEIDYNEEINREGILDKLEDMYHKSREISYDEINEELTKLPFHEEIAQLLKSFANDQHKILIVGNEQPLWASLGQQEKSQLIQVLQELMVNMRKHSQANTVVVRFDGDDNKINIHYQDNGVGIKEIISGNGIKNTESRIISIGGTIIFDSEESKGLKVHIEIPQNSN